MSDHDDHAQGGHEIDKMPNQRLFNLLIGMSALTLLAAIGVVQLFNLQVDSLAAARAKQGAYSLREYNEEMQTVADGYGKYSLKEYDGKEADRYFVPVSKAKSQVLEDPNLLGRVKLRPNSPQAKAWEATDTFQGVKDQGGLPKATAVPPQKRPGKTGKLNIPAKTGKPAKTGRPEAPAKTGAPGKTGAPAKTGKTGAGAGAAEAKARPGKADPKGQPAAGGKPSAADAAKKDDTKGAQ